MTCTQIWNRDKFIKFIQLAEKPLQKKLQYQGNAKLLTRLVIIIIYYDIDKVDVDICKSSREYAEKHKK